MKLLLDENVSPTVSIALCTDGVDACHVRDRGLLGSTDREVLSRAFAEDRIVVTTNVDDFVKLASACDIHAGLILIEGGLLRDEQLAVIRAAVVAIAAVDMANKVAFVDNDGNVAIEGAPST